MPNDARFVMYGEVGGRYAYRCRESDIDHFVDACSRAGIRKIVHSYYHGPSPAFPTYLMHRNTFMRVEPYGYGAESPLARLVSQAHAAGIQVVPFVNVMTGGQWIRADYLSSGEVWPYIRLIGGGEELAGQWTRTRDGKAWLDIGPRSSLGAYGYVSPAYPEARRREQELLVELIERYGVDGVQLEFMIARPPRYAASHLMRSVPCCDEDGYWAYGYDEPVMREYRERFGVDPRTLPNSDPAWVRFRADYLTRYVREVRQAVGKTGKEVEVSIFAFSGMFSSAQDGLAVGADWEAWLAEGLVDAIYSRIPGDHPPFRERFTEPRVEAMCREFTALKAAAAGRATVCPVIELPIYPLIAAGQCTHPEAVAAARRVGEALVTAGADRLGLWWFDTIEALDIWPAVADLRAALGL